MNPVPPKYEKQIATILGCRAIAQVVSPWPLTEDSRSRSGQSMWDRFFGFLPAYVIPPWLSTLLHHPGDEQQTHFRSTETMSHTTDMNMNNIHSTTIVFGDNAVVTVIPNDVFRGSLRCL
jgi:hypothetical protein